MHNSRIFYSVMKSQNDINSSLQDCMMHLKDAEMARKKLKVSIYLVAHGKDKVIWFTLALIMLLSDPVSMQNIRNNEKLGRRIV